jgi:hypothetical protein
MNNLYEEINNFCDNVDNQNQESTLRKSESVQRNLTENQKKRSQKKCGNMRLESDLTELKGKKEILNQNASNQNNEYTDCKEDPYAHLYNPISECDLDNFYGDEKNNDDVLPSSEISNIQKTETNSEIYNRARIQDNENDSQANNINMSNPESTSMISCQMSIEIHKKF